MAFEAVTFDCWNTLLRDPDPLRAQRGRVEALRVASEGRLDDAAAEAVLSDAFAVHTRLWHDGTQHGITGIVADLGERLGLDAPARERLLVALTSTPAAADLRPTDHAELVLAELARHGVRLGLICDTGVLPGSVVRGYLRHHRLAAHLEVLAFSDEVGVPKPHQAIFDHALTTLGATPAGSAHVGDLQMTDVAGANTIGMTSIRYRAVVDDDSDIAPADHVIDDLRELLVVAGVATSGSGSAAPGTGVAGPTESRMH